MVVAGSASARELPDFWKIVKEDTLEAVTPYGIFEIMQRFPVTFETYRKENANLMLAGLPTRVFNKVAVTVVQMEWQGPTLCPADDPRLKAKFTDGQVCWASSSPEEKHPCQAWTTAISIGDPCAK